MFNFLLGWCTRTRTTMYARSPTAANAQRALKDGEFAGRWYIKYQCSGYCIRLPRRLPTISSRERIAVLDSAKNIFNHREGYALHPDNDNVAFKSVFLLDCYPHSRRTKFAPVLPMHMRIWRVSSSLPSVTVDEEWRNVYADFTALVRHSSTTSPLRRIDLSCKDSKALYVVVVMKICC